MLLAVEDSFNRVIDTPKIRGLDLRHVTSLCLTEVNDILKCITPFVSHNLYIITFDVDMAADLGKCRNLCITLFDIYRPFDTQMKWSCSLTKLTNVVSYFLKVIVKYYA